MFEFAEETISFHPHNYHWDICCVALGVTHAVAGTWKALRFCSVGCVSLMLLYACSLTEASHFSSILFLHQLPVSSFAAEEIVDFGTGAVDV